MTAPSSARGRGASAGGNVARLVVGLAGSAGFARAISLCAIGMAFLSFSIRSVIGWPGLAGVLLALVALAAASIAVKRAELEWHGLLPISLLFFLGWSVLSLTWSEYQSASFGSVLYQLAFAFLGVYVALTRDLIQVVRAFGDVLRVVLAGSFVAELLSGILLDVPFRFLSVAGNLDQGGPISGLLGSRNQLGLVALIALITFAVERSTRSVPRPVSLASIVAASLAVLLSASPVSFGALGVVAIAAAAVVGLRRVETARRRVAQFLLLGATVVGIGVLFAARSSVISLLNAGSAFEFRYSLWQDVFDYIPINALEGYGWIGYWRRGLPPFIGIDPFSAPHDSALNAFLDAWLQLGLVGLFAFLALVGLAFVRSWLLASNRRSVIYLWPALIMVTLIVTSAAESSALVDFGWLALIICTVKASQDHSWRVRLARVGQEAR